MPAATSQREIDRKLHRIVRLADSSQYPTAISLGRALAKEKSPEFAYQRAGKTEHSSASTISHYVSFSVDIGLLDGDFAPTRAKSDFRALESFQGWLADSVLVYLRANNASLEQIKGAVEFLLSTHPRQLPTLDSIHKTLNSPPSKDNLRRSLNVV